MRLSGQQLLHHACRLDAGKALVQALVAEREPAMIEPQQLQDGRMEVADVHWVLGNVVRELVGLTVARPALRASSSHPQGEAARVMVTLGKNPRNFAIDPTDTYLLAENQDSDSIVVFRIDPATGGLGQVGQPLGIPMPVCIRMIPEPGGGD